MRTNDQLLYDALTRLLTLIMAQPDIAHSLYMNVFRRNLVQCVDFTMDSQIAVIGPMTESLMAIAYPLHEEVPFWLQIDVTLPAIWARQ